LGITMKYIITSNNEHNPDDRSWYYDDFGNRVDKETGEFVVLVPKLKENITHEPMGLVDVDGQWLAKQMEFDFG
jgi:hypothetical protein